MTKWKVKMTRLYSIMAGPLWRRRHVGYTFAGGPVLDRNRKIRAMNAKKGVGRARLCPTMRAIEARRQAKVAAA